jgi:repressor LexA
MPLTKRQKEILDFLEGFLDEHGYPPSFEEIARHFGYTSLATVHEHLENLRQKGYIRKSYNASRSIELVPTNRAVTALELPLLGQVAAGVPIEAITDQETVAVPEEMVSRGGQHYVLRVRGNSMIDEQIRDGDFVIVNSRNTATNGEVVVALVDGDSATVKKFYREADGRIRLQPANPSMPPMYFPAVDVAVQGVVVGVIRRY